MKTSFTWITKIKPVSWRELLIFRRPKLQRFCLSIRNWCVCLCENIMFRQIGSHVGAVINFFGVSSLLSELVHMYMYIFKTKPRNECVREKSDIKFLFWKDRNWCPGWHGAMKRRFVVFISAWAVQSRKAADFLIVLQGK